MGQRVPYMGKAFPRMGKQSPTDGTACPVYGRERRDMETEEQQDEAPLQRYAMSWEDVMAQFPYGLPASLRHGSWRRFHSSNAVDLERWRRYQARVPSTQP
jgi:hypothetical protein